MRAAGLLSIVMIAWCAGAVHAFEVDGFRSGMPIEDALKLAREKGFAYKDQPSSGLDYTGYSSTNGGPSLVYADGKLCILGHYGNGDMHRFVELVNQRTSLFGPPAYTIHEEFIGQKKFSQIAAKWLIKSDYTHVIIDKIGAGPETISDQYRDLTICPEKKP